MTGSKRIAYVLESLTERRTCTRWSAAAARNGSVTTIRLDLVSAKILVWIASVGRDAELTREAHIYFFDRAHMSMSVLNSRFALAAGRSLWVERRGAFSPLRPV